MPINASIPLGAQPFQVPMPDPNAGMNALAKAMQIKSAMQESDVNALRMQEMQRGIEDKNYLRSALSAPDADPYKILLQRGMLTEANAFQKNKVDADKNAAEAEAKRFEMARHRVDSWGQVMGFVRQNPTPENAVGAVRHLVTLGVIPEQMAQQALSGVQSDPQSIVQWATQGYQAALQAKDQLPKYETKNIGGQTLTQAIDPVTGQVRTVNTLQNTISPDAQLSADTSRANNQATVGATIRGQNMVDARSRETIAQGAIEYKQDAQGNWIALPKKVGPGPIQAQSVTGPGGQPILTKREASASNALQVIQEAEGLIDGATGSYFGAGVDQAARFVGKTTPGAETIAKLKALEGNLMMAQPRMEGPQSDKDVALYRQMAGQIGDPTIPREAKKAALETIKAINQKYAGVPATPKPATQGGVVRISGDAEYNALPSGATFIGPDGKQRRKP